MCVYAVGDMAGCVRACSRVYTGASVNGFHAREYACVCVTVCACVCACGVYVSPPACIRAVVCAVRVRERKGIPGSTTGRPAVSKGVAADPLALGAVGSLKRGGIDVDELRVDEITCKNMSSMSVHARACKHECACACMQTPANHIAEFA